MNMMMRTQVDPEFTKSPYAEHHSTLGGEPRINLWSTTVDYHDELVKATLMAELDGLREAKHISLMDDAINESLYVFLLTYQSVKMDNIERLSITLDDSFFRDVVEAHRHSKPKKSDGFHSVPLYVLLERSYASLESMRRLLESNCGLDRNEEVLLSELMSQERGLMDKAERLSHDLTSTLN